MLSVIGFLLILAPLVVVHELGHFLFAKIFGVRAEVFSVGFGPKILSRQWGETEWRVSAIPLGGYVKLLGEDPSQEFSAEERRRSLQAQPPSKRFWIFFGGPFFNFIFAIAVFMAIMVIGEPKIASHIGRVIEDSPAAHVGFKTGDEILEIDGKKVTLFSEVMDHFAESPQSPVEVKVRRASSQAIDVLTVKPEAEDGFSKFGEEKKIGRVFGILPFPRRARAGISNPASQAFGEGIKTGNLITSINGTAVQSWEELERAVNDLSVGTAFEIEFVETEGSPVRKADFKKDRAGFKLDSVGLYSSELFIEKVVTGSPAEKVGIKAGDRIIGIDDKKISSFYTLKDSVQEYSEKFKKITVFWEREGKTLSGSLVPQENTERDPVLRKVTTFTIGIVPMLELAEARTIIERIWNPFLLVREAVVRMVDFSYRNIVSIGKMITGDVSVATLGGPILIGKIAGDSIERGLISFLTTMAILSIGLGILNILPIPVLDGGHLVLLGLEMIRGKPLTVRQMEIVQQVGLSLILLLMAVVMRNDLSRLAIFN